MANQARVRVESRRSGKALTQYELDRQNKLLIHEFKKRVSNSHILQSFRDKQYYKSPGEIARNKRRSAKRRSD